ncbi:hypothetical protein BGX34_007710 [Mortierella sp. NVP85]|nr:hypothetical protein BGX34_007710 [Mortierella sp. NVP85]
MDPSPLPLPPPPEAPPDSSSPAEVSAIPDQDPEPTLIPDSVSTQPAQDSAPGPESDPPVTTPAEIPATVEPSSSSTPPPESETTAVAPVELPKPFTALPNTTPLPDLRNFNLRPEQTRNPVFVGICKVLIAYGNAWQSAMDLRFGRNSGRTPRGTIQGAISTALALAAALRTFDPIEKLRLNSTTYYRMDLRVLDPSAPDPKDSNTANTVLQVAKPKAKSKRPKPETSIAKPMKRKTVRAMSSDSTITDSSDDESRNRKGISGVTSSKRVRTGSPSTSSRPKALKGVPNGLKKLPKGYVYDTDVNRAALMDLSVDPTQTGEFIELLKYGFVKGQNALEHAYPDRRDQYGVDLKQKPSMFAVEQQTGYTYPRLRTSRRERLPKPDCEDGFAVADLKHSEGFLGRLFCVADGHGGRACSSFVIATFPGAMQVIMGKYKPSDLSTPEIQDAIKDQITEAIRVIDKEYLDYKKQQYLLYKAKKSDHDPGSDGTTLIANIFIDKWVICVNVGDSRSILSSRDAHGRWNVDFFSEDHSPSLERLAQTIYANGGEFVTHDDKVIKFDPNFKNDKKHRLSLKDARIRVKDGASNLYGIPYRTRNGQAARSINLGASIGDVLYKLDPVKPILSCKPDITFIDISEIQYGYVLIASDGLWDYVQRGGKVQDQNASVSQFVGDKLERGWSHQRIVCTLSDREGMSGLYSDSIQEYDDFTAILVVINSQNPEDENQQPQSQQAESEEQPPLQHAQAPDNQPGQVLVQEPDSTGEPFLAMGTFEAVDRPLETERTPLVMGTFEPGNRSPEVDIKGKIAQWIESTTSTEQPTERPVPRYTDQIFDDDSELSEPPGSMDLDSTGTSDTDSASEIDIDDSGAERSLSPSTNSDVDVESTH